MRGWEEGRGREEGRVINTTSGIHQAQEPCHVDSRCACAQSSSMGQWSVGVDEVGAISADSIV